LAAQTWGQQQHAAATPRVDPIDFMIRQTMPNYELVLAFDTDEDAGGAQK
jgi:hypothetical protein